MVWLERLKTKNAPGTDATNATCSLCSVPPAPFAEIAPPAPAPMPLPKFHIDQAWREADKAFQAHYWNCPACKAGGRTRGPLCPQGQQLSAAVDQAFAAA